MKVNCLLVCLLLTAIEIGPLSAETYYVATNGNEGASGVGSWANALATISNAVAKAASGDTILVSNGTYTITAQIQIANGITVRGFNGAANTIVRANPSSYIRAFYLTHSNAVLDGLTIRDGYHISGGGGVFIFDTGGTLSNCIFRNNSAPGGGYGGAVFARAKCAIRNCLFFDNSADRGGAVCLYGAADAADRILQNCTIYRNEALTGGGVYMYQKALIDNCIVYGNAAASSPDFRQDSATVSYSCFGSVVSGTGNITNDPMFADSGASDFHLLPGSPCIEKGTNQAWMTGSYDLDGNDRIGSGTNDMGAFEYVRDGLECGFSATPAEGTAPFSAVLRGAAAGTNTSGVVYQWDFTSDGVYDQQGPDRQVVTNVYTTSGVYSVTLYVTNEVGEASMLTRTGHIWVGPVTAYVSRSGAHLYPYTNWSTASTTIQAAVEAAALGTTVLVTNGTFVFTNMLVLNRGITVQSVNGHMLTTIDGSNLCRCLYLSNAMAVVDGFTIRRGYASGPGGGAYIRFNGTVKNCVLENNTANNNYGGGVYIDNGGLVRNCLIRGNTGQSGGGVAFAYNDLFAAGMLDSCTVVSNTSTTSGKAGGVYMSSSLEQIRNSIVYFNIASGANTNWQGSGTWQYSCTYPSPGGTANITSDPGFKTDGTYQLAEGSPCINKGSNQTWMTGASDLCGQTRIHEGVVDMGAFERHPPIGSGMLILIR